MEFLWKLGFDTIKELETEDGVLASARDEIYGCIFGRDSLITCLMLLDSYDVIKNQYFLTLSKKILINLFNLQGKEENVESGEQPGKCIHEYRPFNHDHLTARSTRPWYLYPGNVLKNYDSVDSTPLLLIAVYRYWQKSKDNSFLEKVEPNVKAGLNWILNYGDSNGDGLIDFAINPNRKSGGLPVQNWMDSPESIFHENGDTVIFPVAPVEVQAYCFLAFRLWSSIVELDESLVLKKKADQMKEIFNQKFIISDGDDCYLASAIDATGRQICSVRSSMGHCFWAGLNKEEDGTEELIFDLDYKLHLVNKLMSADLFEPDAGFRTLSSKSFKFNPNSYHNGSIWPHDSNLIASGLEKHGFYPEAQRVRLAVLKAISHFETPIELFVYNNGYADYCSAHGQSACRKQAWSDVGALNSATRLLMEKSVNFEEKIMPPRSNLL